MAGRKVFTSGEILTAADVNSFLMDQSVMVFADSTARSSAIPTPSEGMVTYVEDANRVEVYDGASFGPIGGILQVVSAETATTVTTTSASFQNIGLSLSITPSSATSKILVMSAVFVDARRTGTQSSAAIQIQRGATSIFEDTGNGSLFINAATATTFTIIQSRANLQLLDSPSSTSLQTYNIRGRVSSTGGTVVFQQNANRSFITLMEVAA